MSLLASITPETELEASPHTASSSQGLPRAWQE